MMKNLLNLSFYAMLMVIANSLSAQVLLFDQTGNVTNNGLVAQDFDALYNNYDCRIADDFVVPSGETWYIDSIIIYGFYGGTQHVDTAGMNVTIYNNNAGSIGSQVFSDVINVNLDPDEDGSIVASWSTPIQIGAGTYWLAASARKDYNLGAGGIWYWRLESSNTGMTAKWENPNGGWNAGCTSWTDINASGCVSVAHSGVVFRIYGCYGPTKPSINELPDDTTFCAGPSLTLTASSNTAGVNFLWNTGDSTNTITVSSAGVYVVTAYFPTTLCGATSNINVNIISVAPSNLTDDTICPGESKVYGVYNCSTCTYAWSTGATSSNITVSSPGLVTLTVTDNSTGCSRVDSGTISYYPLPQLHFWPDQIIETCFGDTIYLTTTQPFDGYFWNSANWFAIKTTDTIMVTQDEAIGVTVTNSDGCEKTDSVYVTFHPNPEPTITVDYTATWNTRLNAPPGYQSYLWSTGSTNIATIAIKSGVYSLTVTDEFGCEGYASLYIIVTDVEDPTLSEFKLYPNPASQVVNLAIPEGGATLKYISLINLQGQTLIRVHVQSGVNKLDLRGIPNGHYAIRLVDQGEVKVIPLIVE